MDLVLERVHLALEGPERHAHEVRQQGVLDVERCRASSGAGFGR